MKADDIRNLSDAEATARIQELQEEQFRLRFRSATETLEQPLRLRTIRRDIARLLTILRERELAAQAPAAKSAAAKAPKAKSAAAPRRAGRGAAK